MLPEDLVSLNDLKEIPKVTFNKLKITNNFDIDYVNGRDFKDFLKNRVLKSKDTMQELYGTYYFNHLQLNG